MATKIYLLIFFSSFGLLILWAVIGGMLESHGVKIDPGIITILSFILFLAMGFTIVPLMIKLFIYGQLKMGHGELTMVKFIRVHEQAVVYCVWGFYLAGLIYLWPLIKEDLFK